MQTGRSKCRPAGYLSRKIQGANPFSYRLEMAGGSLALPFAQNMAKSGTWLKCALGTWNCQSKYVKHGSVCPWLLHHFFFAAPLLSSFICSALERCLPSYMYECPGFCFCFCSSFFSFSHCPIPNPGSWLLATVLFAPAPAPVSVLAPGSTPLPLLLHLFVSKHVCCLWPVPQEMGIEKKDQDVHFEKWVFNVLSKIKSILFFLSILVLRFCFHCDHTISFLISSNINKIYYLSNRFFYVLRMR